MAKLSVLFVIFVVATTSTLAMNIPLLEDELANFQYQDALARNGRVALRAPVSRQ